MADLKESFATLEDDITGAGEALSSRVEGEVAAGKNGSIGFSFKDAGGNVVLPTLDAEGKLPVTSDNAGIPHDAHGEALAGSATFVDLITEVLDLSKTYNSFNYQVSCLRAAHFQLVYIDDVGVTDTEMVICDIILASGQYTFQSMAPRRVLDTTAGTGVQNLVLRAVNLEINKLSALRSCLSYIEVA